jgi:Protein of unknown function (DUF3180)
MSSERPDVAPPGGPTPEGRPGKGPGDGSPEPRMRPTSPATLVVAALVTAAVTWMLISRYYGDVPILHWLPGFTLAALAVGEGVAARNTKARIDRQPGTQRVNPLVVARLAVLAKASSLAGAIFAGAYAGVAAWALAERSWLQVAEANVLPSVAGLIGALALTAAGLLLERACRVPEPPDDEDENGNGSNGARRSR